MMVQQYRTHVHRIGAPVLIFARNVPLSTQSMTSSLYYGCLVTTSSCERLKANFTSCEEMIVPNKLVLRIDKRVNPAYLYTLARPTHHQRFQ